MKLRDLLIALLFVLVIGAVGCYFSPARYRASEPVADSQLICEHYKRTSGYLAPGACREI